MVMLSALETPVSSAAAKSRLVGALGDKVSIDWLAIVAATVGLPAKSLMPDLIPNVILAESKLATGVRTKL